MTNAKAREGMRKVVVWGNKHIQQQGYYLGLLPDVDKDSESDGFGTTFYALLEMENGVINCFKTMDC